MLIDDAVAQEALKAIEAGKVLQHLLVIADAEAFSFCSGCELEETVLQCLLRDNLIERAPVNLKPATLRDPLLMPFGIPVRPPAAGEEGLAGRRLGRNSRGV